jgi:hypothetical protein
MPYSRVTHPAQILNLSHEHQDFHQGLRPSELDMETAMACVLAGQQPSSFTKKTLLVRLESSAAILLAGREL